MHKSADFIIKGRVQGVGFRYFCLVKAKSLGITGFVKNLSDGNVYVCAEGEKDILLHFLDILKQGPDYGYVEKVDEKWSEGQNKYSQFEISY